MMEVKQKKMKTTTLKLIKTATYPLIALLLAANLAPVSRAQDEQPRPVTYTTAPKLVIAKIRGSNNEDVYDVRGKVTFTIVAANSDDTIAGTLNYTLPDDARQKISQMTGKPVNLIKSTVTMQGVIANFQNGTGAPLIHLEISPFDTDVNGAKLHLNRIVVDIPGRQGGPAVKKYTTEEVEVLFTVWTRQINNGRQARGVISRLNRTINGEADQ
ncbi:MAG: hypothetical protein EBZ36_03660 [Acidobacteria bacterium]|nr:hypothetical protein [Acidobacteriota bacterium]